MFARSLSALCTALLLAATTHAAPPKSGSGRAGQLQVTLASGEFVDWKTSITFESKSAKSFRWKPAGTYRGKARWQLLHTKPALSSSGEGRTLIASGAVPLPKGNHWSSFQIPLGDHLPRQASAQGRDYFVRIVALGANGQPTAGLTKSVELIYKASSGDNPLR